MTVYWDLDYCATVSIRQPEEKFRIIEVRICTRPDSLIGRQPPIAASVSTQFWCDAGPVARELAPVTALQTALI
ncbi:hypothetical protein BH711_07840 [Pseudomonas fluorescens]|nr:hypothetical protein PD374_13135 [Pseudomonas sp. WCS374]AOS73842.1 hypothetical protein BH711_07840 [Pseudomonas fluorescens]